MEINPYAAPQAQVLQATSDEELTRRSHLNTEATLKSVGTLYYLGAFLLTMIGGSNITGKHSGMAIYGMETAPVMLVGLGIGLGVTAYGLRRLQSWARIPLAIFSFLGLFRFPWGTLINLYILSQVLGKKGLFVMTPEYQRIIAVTPQVRIKTSMAVWVLLALLISALVGINVYYYVFRE